MKHIYNTDNTGLNNAAFHDRNIAFTKGKNLMNND